jgi:hypothetical protein
MAIPTSTLVFALATCVPFGLAIRDTLRDPAQVTVHDDELARDEYEGMIHRAEEAARAEREALEAREEEETAAKQAKLRTVYGAEPATLGPALGGVVLGPSMPVGPTRERLATLDVGMELEALGSRSLLGVTIVPQSGGRARCSEIENDLSEVWGNGEVGTRGRYWVNPALEQRAALKTLSTVCELRIEKFVEPAAWIDRGKTAVVPAWAVGKAGKDLIAHLEARASVEELDTSSTEQLTWTDTGLGPSGRGRTGLTATLARGRVVTIEASSEVEIDAFDQTTEHLTTLYGAASDEDTMVWKRAKPRLEIEMSAGKVYLTAGTPPE